MKNLQLKPLTAADIEGQVAKILKGLGNPKPPIDLRLVRELLKLDQGYYSTTDHGLLRETINRLKIGSLQVLKRPTLLADAVRSLSLKALYLPDQKRILLDKDLPLLKHRWNEAHEIGHDIIPWHAGMILGDTTLTLTQSCHEAMEAEANYAAGQLLFLAGQFVEQADSIDPSIAEVQRLSSAFGNTMTSTLWRFVENAHNERPMVALVTGHPHIARRKPDFDPTNPCRYCILSPLFRQRFGSTTEAALFQIISQYAGAQRGGPLGKEEVRLTDSNGEHHMFVFETFFNGHEALTLGVWLRRAPTLVGA